MENILNLMPLSYFLFAIMVGLIAGFVKGVVGFAMPMIFISALSSFLSPDVALAGLIFPTVITNGMQAFRFGLKAAWGVIKRFKLYMMVGAIMMIFSAQIMQDIPVWMLYLIIGLPVTALTIFQLVGGKFELSTLSRFVEAGVAAFAGFVGGLSGVWGPQTTLYLTAINTPKQAQIQTQGVIFGLGALLLLAAHIQSGVLRTETLAFSTILIAPSVLGLWLGFKLQDRINQTVFRKLTLFVLLAAGLNLVRKGLIFS